MDKIEQAREALTDVLANLVAAHSLLSRSPKTAAPSNKMFDTMLSDYAKSIKRGREALASLSPTTPVDGVGAEPVAEENVFDWLQTELSAIDLWYRGDPSYEHDAYWLRERVEKLIEEARKAFPSPLANPEAEARLRERVAESEVVCNSYADENQRLYDRAIAAEARLAQAEGGPAVTEAWQPIESAPLDGTTVDLWHEDFGRHTDHYWGVPSHECGEAGSFCDSDWHSISEGWVDGTFNSLSDEPQGFTHWMPHPKPPAALHPQSAAGEEGKP